MRKRLIYIIACLFLFAIPQIFAQSRGNDSSKIIRQRISINNNWNFFKYDSISNSDHLIYDERPELINRSDDKEADAQPTEGVIIETKRKVLKPWILPAGNSFIKNLADRHARPEGNPGSDFPFVQNNFNDGEWEIVDLPHDWAIKGPFQEGDRPEVGGGMGRLPINGVAWYRKKLDIPASDKGKSFFLDIDGAMSYAIVWLNGNLVGGWPYGYASWRLDITPHINFGEENQLAIRIDNPNQSARWYPGAGLYRNVWLVKTNRVHVAQWGTFITTEDVSESAATVSLFVSIDNDSEKNSTVEVSSKIYALNASGIITGEAIAVFPSEIINVAAGKQVKISNTTSLNKPRLWGPPPTQAPNMYVAITALKKDGLTLDSYETKFGVRSLDFDLDKGVIVNGEHISIKGVNQHHDLGALGAAFNIRAAERQLEILREMGCNAIRMSHNPPAPELLELTDRMGFLVVDEIFDVWERRKTPLDFHLIFPDWSEPDTRAFIRRDRNHPSVIMWSYGNEVGEQYTGEQGAAVANRLVGIIKEEDPTRPTTSAMNWAKPNMPFPVEMDIISLNYQGEGIRQDPEFEGTNRIRTKPMYDDFHTQFPDKMIFSSETASAFSSRGIYLFPVSKELSSPVRDARGGDSKIAQVTSYELHAVDFGSTVDKVFGSLERHSFVAGEFVWTGWDYIGEPTPYYSARSSYSGIIDLAGFKKDRFYLYQSHWRPELPMAHILPHWNWPERVGEITPVHVFTSGDEAELFLNGKSLGKKKKGEYEYRLRWDDIKYEPGVLKAVAYKNGKKWVEEVVKTTSEPVKLCATVDRNKITADGKDLSFITVEIADKEGLLVPRTNNLIEFSIEGPGEIIATDNGDPTNMVSFSSNKREAFNGLVLVIVRSKAGEKGVIKVKVKSAGLKETKLKIKSK
ncbi:MAG: glycoside hydrolase family 2 protein [Mariniphaga sp.]|nr:glycoside hydrolase family 2 protein [Mariniphaga sp.]